MFKFLLIFLLMTPLAWASNNVTFTYATNNTINSGTTNQTAVYTGATAISSSSLITDNGTNVGVNSTTPTSALQVVGNVGIGTTATMTTPNLLMINNGGGFNNEYQIASNIGIGTTNVNWNNGFDQNVGIGTNGTNTYITYTAPTGINAAKLQLRILEDSTGSRALPYWPATVKWSGGSVPTLSGANKSDFVNCFWNGTTYYCQSATNF